MAQQLQVQLVTTAPIDGGANPRPIPATYAPPAYAVSTYVAPTRLTLTGTVTHTISLDQCPTGGACWVLVWVESISTPGGHVSMTIADNLNNTNVIGLGVDGGFLFNCPDGVCYITAMSIACTATSQVHIGFAGL